MITVIFEVSRDCRVVKLKMWETFLIVTADIHDVLARACRLPLGSCIYAQRGSISVLQEHNTELLFACCIQLIWTE
jgi:hypothetical protein